MATNSLGALSLLLRAPSKKAVLKAFNRAFVHRNDVSKVPVASMAAELTVSEEEAAQLAGALAIVVRTALFASSVEAAMAQIDSEAGQIDARLRGLIEQILTAQLGDWRDACILQRPSLPRLVEVDWRVDVKTASDQVLRTAVPSVLVDLKVEDQPNIAGQVPPVRSVNFELSKEALETMLDGLGRIRDQLGSVAGQSAAAS